MGLFRLCLALAVASFHTGIILSLPMFGNTLGVWDLPQVCSFFCMSGFYMALVLDKKYHATWRGTRSFYVARFLRLWPPYILVIILIFVLVQSPWAWFAKISEFGVLGATLFAFSNFFMAGADLFAVMAFVPRVGFMWINAVPSDGVWGGQHFLFPPVGTLGVELWFYLLAPLLCRMRTRLLIPLTLAAFGLFHFIATFPFVHGGNGMFTPYTWYYWVTDSFPGSAWYFLCGILSYRAYRGLADSSIGATWPLRWAGVLVLLAVLAVSTYHRHIEVHWHRPYVEGNYTFPMLIALALPFLFHTFNKLRIDVFLGNLSYAVYISHLLVIVLLQRWLEPHLIPIVYFPALIVFAVLLVIVVEQPIDRFRHWFALGLQQAPVPVMDSAGTPSASVADQGSEHQAAA